MFRQFPQIFPLPGPNFPCPAVFFPRLLIAKIPSTVQHHLGVFTWRLIARMRRPSLSRVLPAAFKSLSFGKNRDCSVLALETARQRKREIPEVGEVLLKSEFSSCLGPAQHAISVTDKLLIYENLVGFLWPQLSRLTID